jgi:Dolichyl-phosphate-mannose-protein mannosyltransferase
VLSWIVAQVGDAPELVRVPSLVAGVATVPLVYLLGVRTVDRVAGVVAATWLALSPFQIFDGTESRSYALVTALSCCRRWACSPRSTNEECDARGWSRAEVAASPGRGEGTAARCCGARPPHWTSAIGRERERRSRSGAVGRSSAVRRALATLRGRSARAHPRSRTPAACAARCSYV